MADKGTGHHSRVLQLLVTCQWLRYNGIERTTMYDSGGMSHIQKQIVFIALIYQC